jgi:hypothetical protein
MGFRHGLASVWREQERMAELEQVAQSLWVVEGAVVSFHGFAYPTRSVIVGLDSGVLWVWSPVGLTVSLRQEIDALGPVGHLVSPNKLHHLYLAEWHQAYPAALLWGPASTLRRHGSLTFQPPLIDQPPLAWRDEIDQAWFRGSLYLDEIVFLHRASRTAIFADLIQTFTDAFLRAHWRPWQRALAGPGGIVAAKAQAPLDWRLSFINRKLTRTARDKVVGWNCDRVIVAHGAWPRSDGSAFLKRSLSWLGA